MGNSQDEATEIQAALKKELAERAGAASAKPPEPRPFPPLAPLAGHFFSRIFGDARILVAGDTLVMVFEGSGAELELRPWDGDIFRVGLLARGAFTAVAEALGKPLGFAQFRMQPDGKLGSMEFSVEEDGHTSQTYEFKRD